MPPGLCVHGRLTMTTSTNRYYPQLAPQLAEGLAELEGRKIAVLGHVRPDGDCIGSTVALVRALRAKGFDAVGVNHHAVPANLRAFVGDTPMFLDSEVADLKERVAVAVDCAGRKRLGQPVMDVFADVAINIDHHISNEQYAQHNLIDGEASATAEMLAALFIDLGFEIDAVTAQALYLGIATDTGQFRFSSTTKRTFDLACHLLEQGANPAVAAHELYANESKAKLALLQRFLATFRYMCGGRVCLGVIRNDDWAATGAVKDDTEGLVDYARDIEGVDIGVLLEERDGQLKGSFRAKNGRQRVDLLAKQFNGGGHAAAAGFNPSGTIDEVQQQLEAALEKHFASLDEAR
ncbi:MAG: phosphoesterase RecJ domain-containing protein [Puniceicoccaceae bacterium 5H]|nr:MAG: phosphoesterase RecJ domain-containing protein [Puniceicoccaceae bacterium 5H]